VIVNHLISLAKSDNRVRREKVMVHSGSNPPGNWFVPPGNNQSSGGGNENVSVLLNSRSPNGGFTQPVVLVDDRLHFSDSHEFA
jgi:hypothetical protein